MAEGNLGEYKVLVSADFTGLTSSINAILDTVTKTTNSITSSMSAMTDSIGRSMREMAASTKISAQQSATEINTMNQSMRSVNASNAVNSMKSLANETNNLHPAFDKVTSSGHEMNGMFSIMRSHLEWLATSAIIGGILAIPVGINSITKETDALNAKIRQNLELADEYHGNNQQLDTDMNRLNQTAQTFAQGYGASLTDVQEAMQILSRRFKDVESISYLTSIALTMNKLDFVDLKRGASDLEAVMLQYGLSTQQTRQFLNDFTVAVHTARVTGQDLLDGLERSGSAFAGFNMGTRESIAAIAALSTETARTGAVIGNSFKSIASNFDTKKAVEALDAYGIKLYEVNENGMKTMRQGANIFGELQKLFQQLDDEGKRKLALTLAGGKYQVNALMAFFADANQNFSQIMSAMQEKSSDAMTQQLLAVSLETYQTKINQFKASLQVLGQTLGNQFLPAMENFVVMLAGSVGWLQQHANYITRIANVAMVLGVAYIGVRTAMLGYSIVLGIVNIAFATYTGTVSLATAETWALQIASAAATVSTYAQIAATYGFKAAWEALTAAMTRNPIGFVAIAITVALLAIGGAIYYVYNNWSTVQPALINIWNSIVNDVADAVEILVSLFPGLGIAIAIVQIHWSAVIQYLQGLLQQTVNFITAAANIIQQIIIGISAAWTPFVEGARTGISNFANIIGGLVTSILPDWANKVLSIFGQLASKVSAYATNIAQSIRSTLSIAAGGSMGSFKMSEYGANKEISLQEQIERMRELSYQQMIANNRVPGIGQIEAPTIGNQIPEKNGGKGRTGSQGETEYQLAKKEYEAAVEVARYQAEAVEGRKYTVAEQLDLYNKMLADVSKVDDKSHRESFDFQKGQYELMTKNRKEQLDLQKAQLETAIAEEKVTKRDAFDQEIAQLTKIRDQALLNSTESEQAEQNLFKKIKERDDYEISIAKKKSEINKQYLTDMQELIDKQIEFNEKLHLISPQEVLVYRKLQNNTTYLAKQSENEADIGRTAKAGNESNMISAYREYINAVTELDRENAYNKVIYYTKSEKETLNILANGMKDKAANAKKEQELYQETALYGYRYQLAFLDSFQSSVAEALSNTLNRTKSFADNVRSIFNSLWKALVNQFATDFAQRWTSSLSKAIFGNGTGKDQDKTGKDSNANSQKVSAAQQLQTQLTAVAQQGIAQRTALQTTADQTIQASSQQTQTSITGGVASMMQQMLEMMAIMWVISALFGGSKSSKSSKTAERQSSSYYTTGTVLSLPSYDVGTLRVPEDTLAMVHKNEAIFPADVAENFRSAAQGGSLFGGGHDGNRQNSAGTKINHTTVNNVSVLDGTGVNRALSNNSRDVTQGLHKVSRNLTMRNASRWGLP